MSYRTYINDNPWLGNNEGPAIILEELKRQGCPFDDEWCTGSKEFEVTDLDSLVKATEKCIIEMVKATPGTADFNNAVSFWEGNLTYGMGELRKNAYIFWSSRLLDFVGKENYIESIEWSDDGTHHTVYTLKPGAKCIFKAH